MELPLLSVSQFVGLVNQTLEAAYPRVRVEGEISAFDDRNHIYFGLKDEETVVRCIMWKGTLNTAVEDGMRVIATGRPNLHARYGFSLIVERLEPFGEGALLRAFELLRVKLTNEGLFDHTRKRPLPQIPARIGLITAPGTKGYRDFIGKVNERWAGVRIDVAGVKVEGEQASAQIIAAIDYFNQLAHPVDLLVLIRGGGSLEALQAFNEESVARAIAKSRTPTLAGIGHRDDVTLSELAADKPAASPTEAAELAVPSRQDTISSLQVHARQIERNLNQHWLQLESALAHHISNLQHMIEGPREQLRGLSQGLRNAMIALGNQLDFNLARNHQFKTRLLLAQIHQLQSRSEQLNAIIRTLSNLSPLRVLRRGYAIARLGDRVLRSSAEANPGQELMIQLAKGRLRTEVKNAQTK